MPQIPRFKSFVRLPFSSYSYSFSSSAPSTNVKQSLYTRAMAIFSTLASWLQSYVYLNRQSCQECYQLCQLLFISIIFN